MARTTKANNQLGFDLAIIAPEEHRAIIARRPRRCLSCDSQFKSSGPGHRICDGCKETERWKVGVTEFAAVASF